MRGDFSTDQSIIYVKPGGENCIVSSHQAAAAATPEWAANVLARYAGPDDILLMQGNLALDTTLEALKAARRSKVKTLLNPAPIHYELRTPAAVVGHRRSQRNRGDGTGRTGMIP